MALKSIHTACVRMRRWKLLSFTCAAHLFFLRLLSISMANVNKRFRPHNHSVWTRFNVLPTHPKRLHLHRRQLDDSRAEVRRCYDTVAMEMGCCLVERNLQRVSHYHVTHARFVRENHVQTNVDQRLQTNIKTLRFLTLRQLEVWHQNNWEIKFFQTFHDKNI